MMAPLLLIYLLFTGFQTNAQTTSPASTVATQAVVKRYFEQAMVYPESSLKNGARGKVIVSFDVLSDGKTSNFNIEQGIDSATNAEAIRLASHILWKPATINGVAQNSRESLTVDFNPKIYLKNRRNVLNQILVVNTINNSPLDIHPLKHLSVAPQPILPDGYRSVGAYISKLMKYPEMAIRHGISGTVVIDFVIETSGLASNIAVRESVGGGCDLEAIRIVEQLRWVPGMKDGEFVRSAAEIAIVFRLNEHQQKAIPSQRNDGL